MLEIEKENEIIRLINLNRTTKYDVQSLLVLCREYIDSRMSICSHCGAQIRFAQQQLTIWYNNYKNNTTEQVTTNQSVTPPPKTPGCSSCKSKKKTTK
jgi:hypothetical protein